MVLSDLSKKLTAALGRLNTKSGVDEEVRGLELVCWL